MFTQLAQRSRLFLELCVLIVSLVGVFAIASWVRPQASIAGVRSDLRRATLQVLRGEELSFLVTQRLVTRVVVEQDDSSLLMGPRQGYLIATATIYHGVDLSGLSEADIHDTPDAVLVRLPAPSVLEVAIDPDYEVITKRSGLMALRDAAVGEDLELQLRQRVQEEAQRFAHDHGLLPEPAVLLARLNRFGLSFVPALGKPLRFVFTSEPAATITERES